MVNRKLLVFALTGSVFLIGTSARATSLEIIFNRFAEAYNVAEQLSARLWVEPLPYQEVPISFTNLATHEEFLINHPSPNLSKYEPTPFYLQGKPVYRKKGAPLLFPPAAFCCAPISGVPTVFVIENPTNSSRLNFLAPELLITTFLHEGFHYYQRAAGVRANSVHGAVFNQGKTQFPRSLDDEIDLLIEGKSLYQLASGSSTDLDQIKQLVAIDTERKNRQNPAALFFEDYSFLSEGTAFFVEQSAVKILLSEGISGSVIPAGSDPTYSYFKGEAIREFYRNIYDEYGASNLLRKIHYPSGTPGVLAYAYPLAMINVLETVRTNGGPDWRLDVFDFHVSYSSPQQASDEIVRLTTAQSLSSKLLRYTNLGQEELLARYARARDNEISAQEKEAVVKRLQIETTFDNFPSQRGWRYQIIAGPLSLTPVLDLKTLDYLTDRTNDTHILYFSGLKELRSTDNRLTIKSPQIPIKLFLLEGMILFDDSNAENQGAINCENASPDGRCESLALVIDGLVLSAKNAKVDKDTASKQTVIRIE